MKKMLDLVADKGISDQDVPVCAIGHSKEFLFPAELRNFLRYVSEKRLDRVRFNTYSEFLAGYEI